MKEFRWIHGVAVVGTAALVAAACHDAGTAPGPRRSGGSTSDTAVSGGSYTPTPPAPVVSEFTLEGRVVGHTSGTDSTAVVPIAGATVTLVEVAAVNGDTLQPSIVAGLAVTDTRGAFRIEHLPAAYYRVDAAAPSGSGYGSGRTAFAPPRQNTVDVQIALPVVP